MMSSPSTPGVESPEADRRTAPVAPAPDTDDFEALTDARRVNAGLLLIPGIGVHPRTSVLVDMVEPLLARLAEQRQLVDSSAVQLGDPAAPGGTYDALLVNYAPARAGAAAGSPRHLLVVEGRWEDVFIVSPLKTVSTWAALNAGKMMWELSVYIARGWRWAWSLAAVVLLLAGVALSSSESLASMLVLASALLALVVVIVTDVWPRPSERASRVVKHRVLALTSAGTLAMYEIQRGFVLIVTLAGIVLLPVATVVVRWLSSLPFVGSLGLGMIQQAERALLSSGIADMEAVANNYVACAAIHTRLRSALEEIESRVTPGGTITVVGHSGGAPLAWRLLSEPEIKARAESRDLRYRLVTVGAALNWAVHGFSSLATPLSEPLVNADRPTEDRTFWVNAFTAWDPAPHGPVAPDDFRGWETWDGPASGPNRQMTNLGSPLSTEHSEYFRNQQEFVPELLRAIDSDVPWAKRDAGEHAELLSNLRFAIVSPLVRLRLIVVAIPLAAVTSMIRGRKFICTDSNGGLYDKIVSAAGGALSGALAAAHLTFVGDAVCDNRVLQDVVVAVVLLLAANALMDVYTNFFWQSLGRASGDLRPARKGWFVVPLGAAAIVWLPTALLPFALFYPFDLNLAYWALIVVTLLLVVLEVLWLNECLLAFRDPDRLSRYNLPIGRRRYGTEHTPAGYSSQGRWPGLRAPTTQPRSGSRATPAEL